MLKLKSRSSPLSCREGGESHAHIDRQHISTCQCTYRVVYVVAKQP